MACFLVPATEALVITVVMKVMKSKENDSIGLKTDVDTEKLGSSPKPPFLRKVKWLSNLLWGGSALLAFEHVWHGEVVPWFPFLTAASNPADASVMLHEMSTIGVSMAVLVTGVWAGMVLITNAMEKRTLQPRTATK